MFKKFIIFLILIGNSAYSQNLYIGSDNYGTKIYLTQEEREYLNALSTIYICADPNWLPYKQVNSTKKYTGIISDYINLFSQRINTPIILQQPLGNSKKDESSENEICNIAFYNTTNLKKENSNLITIPFLESSWVYAVHVNTPPITNFKEIINKKIGVINNSPVHFYIIQKYPDINITTFNNTDIALQNLNSQKIYAFVNIIESITHSIEKQNLKEIKIEGEIFDYIPLAISIHKDYPMLVPIFNKAIKSISYKDRLEISDKWLAVNTNNNRRYFLIIKDILITLCIVVFLIYHILSIKKYHRIIEEKDSELNNLSRTDPLTGLMNKKAINSIIENDMHRNLRSGLTSSLLLFDIDYLKVINNQYGFDIGNEIIVEICNKIKSTIRKVDFIARYDKVKILILSSGTSLYNASHLAEKIRKTVENIIFENGIKTTISVGIAEFTNNESIDDWYKRVNGALLRAKQSGRNCVAMDNLLNESDLSIKNPFAQFIWRPEYSSNNPKIDEEHKELFKRISLLSEKLIFRKDKYKLIKELESFIQDSIAHFRDEEDILADKEYPDLEKHKKEHKKLIDRALKLVELYRNDDVNVTEILSFFYFDLIAKHIFEVDTKYFKYMK